jgi:hypothetical protein
VAALTHPEGKHANISLGKQEMLGSKSFPLKDDDQYYTLCPAGSTHTWITEQADEQVLYTQLEKNAPGLDKRFLAPYGCSSCYGLSVHIIHGACDS